jgi:hypothetical protein
VDRTSSGITSVPSSRLGKECPARPRGARLGLRPTLHLNYGLVDLALIQLGPAGHDKLRATMAAYFPRIASFMPPTALRIFPPAFSALPLACSFLLPTAFPASSLILPLAC